jgi:two-component system, NarL family, nitrate/nitrite response regulator NarL
MGKTTTKDIRLLLLDDHALFRESVARLLQAESGFEVVADCSTGIDALRITKSREIAIVLLDLDLCPGRVADFLECLRADGSKGKILLVTAGVNDSEVPNLIRKGISGTFLRHSSPPLLVQGIRESMGGKPCSNKIYCGGHPKAWGTTARHSVALDSRGERRVLSFDFEGLPTSRLAIGCRSLKALSKRAYSSSSPKLV